MASQLRKVLEDKVGEEEIRFTIPHPFLPPRFQEISEGRNMIVLLDRDFMLHVRWEGALSAEHHPLSPGDVRRLLKDVFRRMSTYRRDLEVFGRFANEYGERPFDDHRNDPVEWEREAEPAKDPEEEEEDSEVTAEIDAEELRLSMEAAEMGGESPMPEFDY